MKKLGIVLLMTVGLVKFSQAQDAVAINDLPTGVRTAFSTEFANAANMSWTSAGSGYAASFNMNDASHYVEYDANGKVILHRQELKEAELPTAIASVIKRDHPNHKVEEAEKILKNGTVTYEVEIEGKPDYEIVFDSNGKILEKKID